MTFADEVKGYWFCHCGAGLPTEGELIDHARWRNDNDGVTPPKHALDYFRPDPTPAPPDPTRTTDYHIERAIEWLNRPADPGTIATAQVHATIALVFAIVRAAR